MSRNSTEISSAGHKLGSLIGDWFEEFFVFPLLTQVAAQLKLFLDSRFVERSARGDRIIWRDEEGNSVDYDFVLELGGSAEQIGIPVAFIECSWRRGSRHSKDKARDDTGKLLPMRETYPTARFLGVVWAGDLTDPAREFVRTRDIDLFYAPKQKVIDAFSKSDIAIDYSDTASEEAKQAIASAFESRFTARRRKAIARTLVELIGQAAIKSYVDRVRARLSALPQEIRLILRHESAPLIFRSLEEVSEFLSERTFRMDDPRASYMYQVTYSDGTEFERTVASVQELKELHAQVEALAAHVSKL